MKTKSQSKTGIVSPEHRGDEVLSPVGMTPELLEHLEMESHEDINVPERASEYGSCSSHTSHVSKSFPHR